jgi:hypothetical protein
VARWADRRIAEIDSAPEWLIDLSLSQNKNLPELISDLKQIVLGVDPVATCKAAYALVPNIGSYSFTEVERVVRADA